MSDETGQKMSQQSESGALVRTGVANLPAAGQHHDRILTFRMPAEIRYLWRLFGEPAQRRRLYYSVTLGVPLALLIALVFGGGMSPLVALLVSGLAYAGLFALFVYRTPPQVRQDTIAEEVKMSLAHSRRLIARLSGDMAGLRPLLAGSDGELRLARICNLAGRATAELAAKEGTNLSAADRLETRLAEFCGILELFQKTADAGPGPSPSLTPVGKEVVKNILPLMESWLAQLSTSLKAEDALNLDVAMRVMRDTLESEGVARTE